MCKKKKQDLRTEPEKKAIIRYFTMRDGVKVRVLDFNLVEKPREHAILLIPGFVTVFQSWQKIVEELTKKYRVYYLETREKASSIIPRWRISSYVTFHKMAYDLKEVIDQLKLNEQKYITLASSTGCTIQIEALSEKWIHPAGVVMVGPIIVYNMKIIAPLLISLCPVFLKRLGMPIFRFFIGKVYVDKKKYPEQYAKYVRAAEEADMRKIRKVLWQTVKFQCWELVPKVKVNTFLIGASEDKMHEAEMTRKVHELIEGSKYVDMGTNDNTHSIALIKEMENFISGL